MMESIPNIDDNQKLKIKMKMLSLECYNDLYNKAKTIS